MEDFLSEIEKKELIDIARKTLGEHVNKKRVYQPQVKDSQLKKKRGLFVTLRKGSKLRGCLGSVEARAPLYLELRDMVIAAASQDTRFLPLTASELEEVKIEISVLSPLRKVNNPDEIIPGKHGVLVRKGFNSGVFLPQVAKETGWSKAQFMDNLCEAKAGLAADAWRKGGCDIFIFRADVFGE